MGCALWLLGALIFAMVAWTAVPVKVKSAEFESFLEEQAKFSARATPVDIHNRIMARAEEMEIPLDPKKLEVRKGRERVRIRCEYTIPLEFPFYTYQWTFEHLVDRPIFIF